MAREPQLIDLLREPRRLRYGDIIGVQVVDPKQLTAANRRSDVRGNSNVFNIPGAGAPSMRAFFMGYNYDAQDKDKITSLTVMLFSPTSMATNIPNNQYTLMITQQRQKDTMGVDSSLNWRLNYTPISVVPDRRHMGVDEDLKVWKYGYTPDRSLDSINAYLERLAHDEFYQAHNFLSPKQLRQLRGEQAQDTYGRIATSTAINAAHLGGQRDARAAERIDAAKADAEKAKLAQAKTDAAEAAKAELRKQKESPSGSLAFNKLKLRFNEQADPDISLENAHELKLINEDDFIYIETIAPAMGINSLRGAYDTVVKHPVHTLAELVKQGVCTEEAALEFKKSLDSRLKDGVVQFFERTRPINNDMGDKIIPYSPPRAPENL